MSDFTRILATLLLAANPLLLAASMAWRPSPLLAGQATVAAGVLLVAAALLAEPLLDALSIEPETFRIAAGAIAAITGAAALLPFGQRAIPEPERESLTAIVPGIFPLAWPGIASAGAVAAAISYGANDALPATLAAIVVSAAAAAALLLALGGRARLLVGAGGRLCGALLIVLAADLIVSGVKTV